MRNGTGNVTWVPREQTYLTMSQHNVAGSLETVAEPEDHHKRMVKIEPPDEDVGVDAHLRPVRGRKRPDVHGDLHRGAFVKGDRDGVYLEDAEEEEEEEEESGRRHDGQRR